MFSIFNLFDSPQPISKLTEAIVESIQTEPEKWRTQQQGGFFYFGTDDIVLNLDENNIYLVEKSTGTFNENETRAIWDAYQGWLVAKVKSSSTKSNNI